MKTALLKLGIGFLLLVGCLAGGAGVSAPLDVSSDWLVRSWQTDEGLPDNSVSGVAQGDDGYLWVATYGGLMRFNGAQFEDYPILQLPEASNRIVRRMHLDRRGRLWLVMDRGTIIRVDARAARAFTRSDGLLDRFVTALAEDRDGALWLACGSTFYRIHEETVTRFSTIEGVPPGGNAWVAVDTRGELWFARGEHIGVYRRDQWRVLQTLDESPLRFCAARSGGVWICTATQLLKLAEEGGLEVRTQMPGRLTVRAMHEDRGGAVWIGTATDGLLRAQGGVVESVPVSHPEITSVMEDREANVWVGTAGGGLNLLRPHTMELVGTEAGLPLPSIRSVCQDAQGWVWAVLQDGTLARARNQRWQAVTARDGWPGGLAVCVTADREEGVWVATRDRGLQRWHAGQWQTWSRRELAGGSVRSLLHASNGDLWVSLDSPSQLYRFRDGVFQNMEMSGEVRSLRALAEGADGTLWVGTSDGQILRVQGRALVPEPAAQPEERLLSVRTLHTTSDGSLWIGYAGWGLGRLVNGHYARITTAEGLHDDYISQILSDDRGRMWFTGNRGLFQVGQAELVAVAEGGAGRVRAIVHGRNAGLAAFQPVCDSTPSAWRAAGGELLFATRNGLLRVHSDHIDDNPTIPPVVLERVLVDDQDVALRGDWLPLRRPAETGLMNLRQAGGTLWLPPNHQKVEFRFAALSYTSPDNVHYRYRLKRFDQKWIEAGSQRTATYPRLPAGRYAFEVTACNETGVWNEQGFHLAFSVQPFFWQTWWFRLGAVAGFTAMVIGLVRYLSFRRLRRQLERLERQAELQRERARIARDMHDEVGAKLSRLSLLSDMAGQPSRSPASVQQEVAEISETARDTIRSFEEIVWAVNPRNDSLADLVHYLCRFAEELFEGMTTQCAFDLPDDLPAVELPTELRHHLFLAAKEALHNVLKHAHARQVWVRVGWSDAGLEMVIEDDGCGFAVGSSAPRAGGGNGLGNMRERMRQAQGDFEIHSRPGEGTRVVLRMRCPHQAGLSRQPG